MHRCFRCRFIFADDSQSTGPIQADYGREYFDPFLARDSQSEWRSYYGTVLDRLAKVAPGRRILDAGSGTSGFAPLANESGWLAWVVDGSSYAVEFLAKEHGIPGGSADLNGRDAIRTACGRDCSFDVVNSFHVIEHLRTPREYLLGIHDVLIPGGVLRIGFPYYPFLRIWAHEFGRRLGLMNHPYNFGIPDHVSFFDESTIRRLLGEVGFDVLSVEKTAFDSIHGLAALSSPGRGLRKMVRQAVLATAPLSKRIGVHHHLDIIALKRR